MRWHEQTFVAVDVETTGLDPVLDRIVEVGWTRVERGRVTDQGAVLIDPGVPVPADAARVNGLTSSALVGRAPFGEALPSLLGRWEGAAFFAAWNAPFDRAFLAGEMLRVRARVPLLPWVDPCLFARATFPSVSHRLFDVARRFHVAHERPHRAEDDAAATAAVLLRLAPYVPGRTLDDVLAVQHRWRARTARAQPALAVREVRR